MFNELYEKINEALNYSVTVKGQDRAESEYFNTEEEARKIYDEAVKSGEEYVSLHGDSEGLIDAVYPSGKKALEIYQEPDDDNGDEEFDVSKSDEWEEISTMENLPNIMLDMRMHEIDAEGAWNKLKAVGATAFEILAPQREFPDDPDADVLSSDHLRVTGPATDDFMNTMFDLVAQPDTIDVSGAETGKITFTLWYD